MTKMNAEYMRGLSERNLISNLLVRIECQATMGRRSCRVENLTKQDAIKIYSILTNDFDFQVHLHKASLFSHSYEAEIFW